MSHILCAGLITVDLVYRVDRIPGVDEKAQATGVTIAAGGPAANAAVTAAALGAEVTLVTAVGSHPLASLIRADLDAYGVRLIDAAPLSDAPPPVSAITVLEGTGQRTIVSRNAGDAQVGVPADGLPDADLTLVDGHHPLLALAAARSARRLLVDAGSWRPIYSELLPYAEVVAASAVFRHPSETAPTDAALAAAVGAPHVVVTHGPDPVRWFSGTRSGSVPVPSVAAVDTAGAGDAFHGALAVALADADLPRPASLPPTGLAPTGLPRAGLPTPGLPLAKVPAPAVAPDPALPRPYTDKSDLSDCIAFGVRVAGVRVTHAGPRAWLAALP
jgi:sugar/nucleoside kinase (ribokinase family)